MANWILKKALPKIKAYFDKRSYETSDAAMIVQGSSLIVSDLSNSSKFCH